VFFKRRVIDAKVLVSGPSDGSLLRTVTRSGVGRLLEHANMSNDGRKNQMVRTTT
jgi:hypothetical protein